MYAKPYSTSCDENRAPILTVLKPRLRAAGRLLEVGSGTGQHAAYFAPTLPHLTWQTSDLPENLPGIRAWLAESEAANLPPPLELDVLAGSWPAGPFDAVFSANTAHIMGKAAVTAMFAGISRLLIQGGLFLLYGPFNKDGQYTAPSNREFDAWLQARDPAMGVRDMAWLDELAHQGGLRRDEEIAMPADNFILVWRHG
jgi:cyclopropane fatty-acyl-phospholipid synthase-like methyltransferase